MNKALLRSTPELVAVLKSALADTLSVRFAYLFGSAARGSSFADVDVAVMLEPSSGGAQALGSLIATLEEAVGDLAVDVVDLAAAAPALAGQIAREGIVLLDRDPDVRKLWEVEVNRRALDIEPWLNEFERLRRLALRERTRQGG